MRKFVEKACNNVLPPIILTFASWGWYLSTFEVGVGWIYRVCRRPVTSVIYIAATNLLLVKVVRLYVSLWRLNRYADEPPMTPPQRILRKIVPFECADASGTVPLCNKDQCKGRWKAPRSHHCSTCGTCKLEWDHHCPWIGNCVSASQKRRFVELLWLTPPTIFTAVAPILSTQLRFVIAAMRASLADEWVLRNWWHWPGSWIIYGGPIGRYVAGVVYGYRILQRALPLPSTGSDSWPRMMSEPRISVLSTVAFSLFIAAFSQALAVQMTINTSKGETTLDVIKRRGAVQSPQTDGGGSGPLFWIPKDCLASKDAAILPLNFEGMAIPVLPGERPYDLGRGRNWQRLWNGSEQNACELNPAMLERMKNEVLRRAGDTTL